MSLVSKNNTKLILQAILGLICSACATNQPANIPTDWRPIITDSRNSMECINISGIYPDKPEQPKKQEPFLTYYEPFGLNWVLLDNLELAKRKLIRAVKISTVNHIIKFKFLDKKDHVIADTQYYGSQLKCDSHEILIKKKYKMTFELATVNSRNIELHFYRGVSNNYIYLKFIVVDAGVTLFVVPYKSHDEYWYRFKRLESESL